MNIVILVSHAANLALALAIYRNVHPSFAQCLHSFERLLNRSLVMPTKRSSTSNHTTGARPSEALAALSAIGLIVMLVGVGYLLVAHRASGPRVNLLVGADITGSMHSVDRQKVFGVLDETVSGVMPKDSLVELWSYDVNAHKFSDLVPKKAEDLWPDEDRMIALKSTTTPGTYPARAFKEMEPAIERARQEGKGAAIMLLTDGEDQDVKSTIGELKHISNMTNLKAVWFVGTTSENGFRSLIERNLGPILGERLVVTSKNDATDGMNRFHALIEK